MNVIKQEEGNVTLLTLGSLVVITFIFFIFFSFSEVLYIKQEASSAAQQASLAASNVYLDEAKSIALAYDSEEDNPNRGAISIAYSEAYDSWRMREPRWQQDVWARKAWIDVLSSSDSELQGRLESGYDSSKSELESVARKIVEKNGATFKRLFFDSQTTKIIVEATKSTHFEFWDKHLGNDGAHEKEWFTVTSEAAGIEFPFLSGGTRFRSISNTDTSPTNPLF